MNNDSLTARLNRVNHLVAKLPGVAEAVPARYERLTRAVGGEPVLAPAGCFLKVLTVFPFGHRLGSVELRKPDKIGSVAASSYSALETEGEIPLSELVFIDTETTGLGGAGAVPFLIGCGSLVDNGFEVRQYLLPDYADEAAMLEHVLTELGRDKTLVSYNGTAFDLNLIRDRFIVNRVARDVPRAGHFDLLHSARRLFKRRLNDCSLISIEREIFGFYRRDDIPGHLIPSVYFDWLQTESTEFLPTVLEHNRADILSLYFLLLRVDEVFRTEGAVLDYSDDLYSLSRVYGRRKRHEKVIANFQTLTKVVGPAPPDDVLFYHSMAYKRQGDWEGAIVIWEKLVEGASPDSAAAALELAKHFEHRIKDAHRALHYAEKARQSGTLSRSQNEQLQIRLARLRRKLAGRPQ